MGGEVGGEEGGAVCERLVWRAGGGGAHRFVVLDFRPWDEPPLLEDGQLEPPLSRL